MSHFKDQLNKVRQLVLARQAAEAEAKRLLSQIAQALIEISDSNAYAVEGHAFMADFLRSLEPGISRSFFYQHLAKARKSGGVK